MPRLTIRQGDAERTAAFDVPQLLSEVLWANGAEVPMACGGAGQCGQCRVRLDSGETVLACKTPAADGMIVLLPEAETAAISLGAVDDGSPIGAAIDLGTTTVAARLIRLTDGAMLAQTAQHNAQAFAGADVMTRCSFVMTHAQGLDALRDAIRAQLASLLRRLCVALDIAPVRIVRIAVAGNTVMQHLLAGLDPTGMAAAPFMPRTLFANSETVALHGFAHAPAMLTPCLSGFIGGDITAGLAATDVPDRDEIALFIDVGTNGEMALRTPEGYLCCATATGPAFEGSGIACGMRYGAGAVSHVAFDRTWRLTGASDGQLRGFCGSALVDLLSEARRIGLIEESGKVAASVPMALRPYVKRDASGMRIQVNRQLYLTDAEIRKLQLAKAAVAAGVRLLLDEAGVTAGQVARVLITGGFGTGLWPASLVGIGMLPKVLEDRISFLDNTSLTGAAGCLTDTGFPIRVRRIVAQARTLTLAGSKAFNDAFVEAMRF